MKKILLISFLFCLLVASGQVISEFETGYIKLRNIIVSENDNKIQYDLNSLYSKFYLGYKYKSFKVLTETSIFFNKRDLKTHTFSPTFSEFIFSASYYFKKVEIGYSHLCSHPIISQPSTYNSSIKFYQSYDKIFIKVSIR